MQVLKIIIPGEFWDSQIYKGRLYLFGVEKELRILNWDSLADEMNVSPYLQYAFVASFIRGNDLYSPEKRELLQDAEIRAVLLEKFTDLANQHLEINNGKLDRLTIWHRDSPFPFPHSDSLIYVDRLYTVGRSGIFSSRRASSLKRPIDTNVEKLWDCPVLNASASYYHIALATGNEGLYELGVMDYADGEPNLVSAKDCSKCDWIYYSLYCSSGTGVSYMAAYTDLRKRGLPTVELVDWRRFERTIDAPEIFDAQGYSWGTRDKIYLIHENTIDVIRYNPWKTQGESYPFERMDSIYLAAWKGEIITAAVAAYGLVIECDNAIVIIPSSGEPITLPGEPVNWRIFPRSVYYENQLHILYEDRLEILSFSHDYFIDQKAKLAGYIYKYRPVRGNL